MSNHEERVLIYTALALICAFVGVFTSPVAALLTLLQIVALVEALFWFGMPDLKISPHRQHRQLFKVRH